jgi:hypothetical protein
MADSGLLERLKTAGFTPDERRQRGRQSVLTVFALPWRDGAEVFHQVVDEGAERLGVQMVMPEGPQEIGDLSLPRHSTFSLACGSRSLPYPAAQPARERYPIALFRMPHYCLARRSSASESTRSGRSDDAVTSDAAHP